MLGDVWGHKAAQGHAGQHREGAAGRCGTRGPPLTAGTRPVPPQVKMSLQGTAPHEEPIAFKELAGACRTSYGYSDTSGAGPAPLLPAALLLALPLLSTLLS